MKKKTGLLIVTILITIFSIEAQTNMDNCKNTNINGYFNYNDYGYTYNIKCNNDVFGYCIFTIKFQDNGSIVFKDSLSNCNGWIYKNFHLDQFIYFESEEYDGGNYGGGIIRKYIFDMERMKLFKIEYYCADIQNKKDCQYNDIDEFKKDKKAYDFLKLKVGM